VDEIYQDLKYKHIKKYDTVKLCLWARMISSNLHDDVENLPCIFWCPSQETKGIYNGCPTVVVQAKNYEC